MRTIHSVILGGMLVAMPYGCKKDEGGKDNPAPAAAEIPQGSEEPEEKKKASGETEGEDKALPQIGSTVTDSGPATQQTEVEAVATGALALVPTSISLKPADDDDGLGLAESDFDKHREEKFTWDPAQEPLKSMNKILCMLANTAYGINIDKGPYKAKIKVKDCFEESGGGAMMGTAEGGQGGGGADLPSDVIVKAIQGDGFVDVQFYFDVELDFNTFYIPNNWLYIDYDTGEGLVKFYANARVFKNARQVPPYGLFRLTYEMRAVIDNIESNEPQMIGYVDIYESNGKIGVKYREHAENKESYTWNNGSTDVTDTWIYTNTSRAIAELDIQNKRVVGGVARTASEWGQEYDSANSTGTDSYSGSGSWSDNSGSYSMAFDKLAGSSDSSKEHQARSLVKWIPGAGNTGYNSYGGYDPTAPRCEEVGKETPITWEYALFTEAGAAVIHQTYFMMQKEGAANPWESACWVSEWGSSCWGDISDGDQVGYSLPNGTRKTYTVKAFPGQLMDLSDWSDITASTTGNLTLTCSNRCPKANFTQQELDDRWSASPSLYLDTSGGDITYVFDGTTKELKYNGDAVKLQSGQEGYLYIQLEDGSSNQYEYSVSSWNQPVALLDASDNVFTPPSPLEFKDEPYDAEKFARANAKNDPSLTNLSDATWDNGNLVLENGWLNVGYYETDLINQWGGNFHAPKVTFKKGAKLKVNGDPDGPDGPRYDGEVLVLAPAFSELRAKVLSGAENDCSAALTDKVDNNTLALPEALPAADHIGKDKLPAKPAGTALPVRAVEGQPVLDDDTQLQLKLNAL